VIFNNFIGNFWQIYIPEKTNIIFTYTLKDFSWNKMAWILKKKWPNCQIAKFV
jgi:hypothetical protein